METPSVTEAGNAPASPPDSIREDAEWYAANHMKHYHIQNRLRDYIEQHGPIRIRSGKVVGLFAAGNEWDHTGMGNEFPELIEEMTGTLIGPAVDVWRALDVATEEVQTVRIGPPKYTIDRDAANGVLKGEDEAAARLRQHVHPKNRRLDTR